jgi:hypothetical protein
MFGVSLGIIDSGGAGGGGGASFESIATATGTGSSGTITFSSIPSTYKHLQIRSLNIPSAVTTLYISCNSLGGTNYAQHFLLGEGTTTAAGGAANSSSVYVCGLFTSINTTNPNVSIIDVQEYKSTTQNKTIRIFSGHDNNGGGEVNLVSGLVKTTNAITSISLFLGSGNFATTSVFSLYGIKG